MIVYTKQLTIMFALVFAFIGTKVNAQQEKDRKWDVAFSYGLAAPLGIYGEVAPEESLILDAGFKYFRFNKEGHSAAKNGRFFSFDLNYKLNKHWLISLIATQSRNTVDTKQVMDFLNTVFDPGFSSVANNDYRVNSLAVGFGYQFYVKKFYFRLIPILGGAGISSPEYSFSREKQYLFDVPCKQNSFLLGLNSGISYQFSSIFYLGLKFDFNSANFSYTTIQRAPGSSAYLQTDVVNYRVLKTGLTLGIRL